MKTGVILAIRDGVATILLTGGAFIQAPAKAGWHKGAVVSIQMQRPRRGLQRALAAAACLVLLLTGFIGTHRYVNAEAAVISIDVNPSVELAINRMGRVNRVTAYTDAYAEGLPEDRLVGLPYEQAIRSLLSSTMAPYLQEGGFVEVSVYTADQHDERISSQVEDTLAEVSALYPQLETRCTQVDEETVAQARSHHMTPTIYLAVLELREIDPTVEVESYAGCSIGEVRSEIRRRCGEQGGARHGQGMGGGGHGRRHADDHR